MRLFKTNKLSFHVFGNLPICSFTCPSAPHNGYVLIYSLFGLTVNIPWQPFRRLTADKCLTYLFYV